MSWPVGTVAVATVRGVENVRVLRTDDRLPWRSAQGFDNSSAITRMHGDADVTDVRPLIVLDPQGLFNRWTSTANLVAMLRDHAPLCTAQGRCDLNRIADAIEGKPQVEEPTRFGAIVHEPRSGRWSRTSVNDRAPWRHEDTGDVTVWAGFCDPEVLFEGVE